MLAAQPAHPEFDADACYRALCSHDARFDGQFFTAVTSTGIYCRPVCRVRTPKRENCLFFRHAAQAELAGFRPCLRCRPELAPQDRHWSTEDASSILLQQATRWLDNPHQWFEGDAATPTLSRLANHLGVSDRHLRRVFDAHLGLSPLQYLLTRKLLAAKQLLTDTQLPIADVALASGFGSQRRFNTAFMQHYGLQPGQLRRQPPAATQHRGKNRRVMALSWRPPWDASAMWRFFAQRHIRGVEQVEMEPGLVLRRTLQLRTQGRLWKGWLSITLDTQAHRAELQVSESLLGVLPAVIWRVRAMLDLDADPSAIHAALRDDFPGGDGLRVPGAADGFELAVRAILGQQVTVAAARTLAQRLTEHLGEYIETPWPDVNRLFPTPECIAHIPPETLGELGIVRQRQAALRAVAHGCLSHQIALDPHADPQSTIAALQAMPGIGPWTAQYIAMRALRWPDAWLTGDVALTKALGLPDHRGREAHRSAEERSQRWRPWRSYAVIRAWAQGDRAPDTRPNTPPSGAVS
jgi:AraC family transcriptional regulator, regulatory protein of adaptative response / DNA-3-methyladenine glycosylase II